VKSVKKAPRHGVLSAQKPVNENHGSSSTVHSSAQKQPLNHDSSSQCNDLMQLFEKQAPTSIAIEAPHSVSDSSQSKPTQSTAKIQPKATQSTTEAIMGPSSIVVQQPKPKAPLPNVTKRVRQKVVSIEEINEKLKQSAQQLLSCTWQDVGDHQDDNEDEEYLGKLQTFSPIKVTSTAAAAASPDAEEEEEEFFDAANGEGQCEDTTHEADNEGDHEHEAPSEQNDVDVHEIIVSTANESEDYGHDNSTDDLNSIADISVCSTISKQSVSSTRKNKTPVASKRISSAIHKIGKSVFSSTFSSSAKKVTKNEGNVYPEGRTCGESVINFDNNLRKNSVGAVGTPAMNGKEFTAGKSKRKSMTSPDLFCSPKLMRNADGTGRPSFGTIQHQWEFMKTTYFNNNDEELEWTMVSRGKGAYHFAHKKYELAEDKYFKCLYEIDHFGKRMFLYTEGVCAKVVKQVDAIAKLHQSWYQNVHDKAIVENILLLQSQLKKLVDFDKEIIKESFSENSAKGLFALIEAKIDKITVLARTLNGSLPAEVQTAKNKLSNANQQSEDALINMEKWSKRERETDDYHKVMREEEHKWLEENLQKNTEALVSMRSFIPVLIAEMSVNEILDGAKAEGALYSLELATELKQNKLLHWIITHPDDIATSSFLAGEKKAFFENIESLDVIELRALSLCLPAKFELDNDGKKAEWRARLMARAKQLSDQDLGVKVKGCWDPKENCRSLIQLPALKPEQQRRAVYYFRTKEQSEVKLKVYNIKLSSLAKKESELTIAEAEAKDAKEEYDILLNEMRDKDFAELLMEKKEVVHKAKELARSQKETTEKKVKRLNMEINQLRNTIKSLPISRDQFVEMESELREYIKKNHDVDWEQKGLTPFKIDAPFDPAPTILKQEKQAAKFVSAEEEAEQRKKELNSLMKAGSDDTGTGDDVTATPIAKPIECRRLTSALIANFNKPVQQLQIENHIPMSCTPRRRNSVLTNANQEFVSNLNRMLMTGSSPATPCPKSSTRASIFGSIIPSFGSMMATSSIDGPAEDPDEQRRKRLSTLRKTKSRLLRQLLGADVLSPKRKSLSPKPSGGGSTSPKRPLAVPGKLNFLDQLKAKAKTFMSSNADESNTGEDKDKENAINRNITNLPPTPPQQSDSSSLKRKSLSPMKPMAAPTKMSFLDELKMKANRPQGGTTGNSAAPPAKMSFLDELKLKANKSSIAAADAKDRPDMPMPPPSSLHAMKDSTEGAPANLFDAIKARPIVK